MIVTLFLVMPVVIFLVNVVMSSLLNVSSSTACMFPFWHGTKERTSSMTWSAVIPRTGTGKFSTLQPCLFICGLGKKTFLTYLRQYSWQHLLCEWQRRDRGARCGRGALWPARVRHPRCPRCASSHWRRRASRERQRHRPTRKVTRGCHLCRALGCACRQRAKHQPEMHLNEDSV